MDHIKNITILGAGAVGSATAGTLSHRGFKVTLYNRPEDAAQYLGPIRDNGGVRLLNGDDEGNWPIHKLTSDLREALDGADLVMVMTTACGQRSVAAEMAPYVRDEQIILLCSGGAGILEFHRIWRELGFTTRALTGEMATMPLSARIVAPGQYIVRLPSTPRTAAFPGCRSQEFCQAIAPVFGTQPVENVLDTGINNPNWLIHPLPMVLNYAEIERQDGLFSLMNEGMCDCVVRAMDAFDEERIEIQRKLGLPVVSVDDIYIGNGSGPWVYRSKGEPMGIKDRIHMRYVNDDIPYGSMFLASLAAAVGVATPVIDATNILAVLLARKDYWSEARTVEKLGLAAMDVEQINYFLKEGRSD